MKRIHKNFQSSTWIVLLFLIVNASSISKAATFTVTSKLDPIPYGNLHTLRWAIDQANQNNHWPIIDRITFDIQGSVVPATLQLCKPLFVTEPVEIDGSSQNNYGYVTLEPKIEIQLTYSFLQNYFMIPVITIESTAHNSTVNELAFLNFSPPIVSYGSMGENANNAFLKLNSSSDNTIKNCVFLSFGLSWSIQLSDNSDGNKIQGNFFNSNRDMTNITPIAEDLWDEEVGIALLGGGANGDPDNNVIGGPKTIEHNFFSPASGVDIYSGINNTIKNFTFFGRYPGPYLKNWDPNHTTNTAPQELIAESVSGGTTTLSGTGTPDDSIEVYSYNATFLGLPGISFFDMAHRIGSTKAGPAGTWTLAIPTPTLQQGYLALGTNSSGNTALADINRCPICSTKDFSIPNRLCVGEPIEFINTSTSCNWNPYLTFPDNRFYYWKFGDGNTSVGTTNPDSHTYTLAGTYDVTLVFYQYYENIAPGDRCKDSSVTKRIIVTDCTHPCRDCIGSFSPEAGDYILTAWVKEESPSPSKTSYTEAQLQIELSLTTGGPTLITAMPSGNIIDGWQRVEKEFNIPPTANHINIRMKSLAGSNCLFDDIRIQPTKSGMKSYVYDPVTLKLSAEQDERNYSTFYEYDEEGKLVRIKKETERGVMTIQENKNNTVKR